MSSEYRECVIGELGMTKIARVMTTAWILIMIYVRWTNTHYDHRVADERRSRLEGR